jgi:hypothetical protein
MSFRHHVAPSLIAIFVVTASTHFARAADAVADAEREAVRKGALEHWEVFTSGNEAAYNASMISQDVFALTQAIARFQHAAAGRRLHDALVKKFAAEGEKLSKELDLVPADTTRPRIAEAKITVKGKTATLDHEDDKGSLHWTLRQDEGRWKLDPAVKGATRNEQGASMNTFDRVAKARDAVAQEITSGRVTSVADAKASLEKQSKPLRPSSRPSTRRGSPTTRRSTTTRPAAGIAQ